MLQDVAAGVVGVGDGDATGMGETAGYRSELEAKSANAESLAGSVLLKWPGGQWGFSSKSKVQ